MFHVREVNIGVPQGSVLVGLILFFIYINDLTQYANGTCTSINVFAEEVVFLYNWENCIVG